MKDYTVLDGQITCLRNKLYDEAYQRGYEDGQEYEQMLRTPKHDADRIEQIKDLIRECEKIDAYLLSYPAWRLINKLKKIVGWQLEDYEERKTDEIKVGDEVKVYDDCIGIVTRHAPQARTCYVMYRDGSCGEEELTDCKKTGNHSMSLDKWLEQMRKESE